jgi:DNA (cytosine-5)-methyltransferase 1
MAAYYNEIDPKAAAWLRELIKQGHIADGIVDERSIIDVTPNELRDFTQCHFFAGIGVWSYALRSAGWADDRPVWTGSCPCQPFSAAGARGGFDDERHLWPHWHHLISQCRPPVVFGEQVASKDGLGWLDLVCADMEATGYAIGAADLCAAGIGAPHIRQRLWFVGLADTKGGGQWTRQCEKDRNTWEHRAGSYFGGLDDTCGSGQQAKWSCPFRDGQQPEAIVRGAAGGMADTGRPRPTNGFWRDADWLFCRDGKWRPVEPSTSPLAYGVAGRVGRLRGYGNAIVAPVAQIFIEETMNIIND